jgi:hypothetical protein
MTLEQLDQERQRLGDEQIKKLRTVCKDRPNGHRWTGTDSGIDSVQYCADCLFISKSDDQPFPAN